MATTSISSFSDNIRPFVKGCPDDAIEAAVREACIELCEKSLVIRVDITPGDIVTGFDDYTITADSDTLPLIILSLMYDDNSEPLLPKTEKELDIIDPGWRTADAGPATWFIGLARDRFRLNRVPDEDITDGLTPRIATRPTEDAEQVDIRLLNEYSRAIKHGALSDLMEIPDKPWSDDKRSLWHGNRFNVEIQRARSAADKGYQLASTYVKPRNWI